MAVGGKASSTEAIISRCTIDASSTISTSTSSGLPAWWAKARVSGRAPSKLCRVRAAPMRRASSSSGKASPTFSARPLKALSIDCFNRAAALPVGAASAMRSCSGCGETANSRVNRLATVYVLPVPGPPVMMATLPRRAMAHATFCQSGPPSCVGWSNRMSSHCRTCASGGVLKSCARTAIFSPTSVSSRQ